MCQCVSIVLLGSNFSSQVNIWLTLELTHVDCPSFSSQVQSCQNYNETTMGFEGLFVCLCCVSPLPNAWVSLIFLPKSQKRWRKAFSEFSGPGAGALIWFYQRVDAGPSPCSYICFWARSLSALDPIWSLALTLHWHFTHTFPSREQKARDALRMPQYSSECLVRTGIWKK